MKLFLTILLSLTSAISATGQPTKEISKLTFNYSDLRILQKADSILSGVSKWNRHDDRECNDDIASGKYSLFCALYKASIDVTGKYDHRRAAMQLVRSTIEKHDSGAIRQHRLMDWNNSRNTTFAELKQVLKESADTVNKQLK